MSDGYITGISGDFLNLRTVQRKMMHNASFNFLGCQFARGYYGKVAIKKVSESLFGDSAGIVRGFMNISTSYMFGLEIPLSVDSTDMFSFGGKREFVTSSSGKQCLISTEAIYSNL